MLAEHLEMLKRKINHGSKMLFTDHNENYEVL